MRMSREKERQERFCWTNVIVEANVATMRTRCEQEDWVVGLE